MLSKISFQMTPKYWALIALLTWGAAIIATGMLRFDAFAIEEEAARALLLVWSVVDRIINPIFVLGMPDLRSLLFVPVGIYWPGSVTAAKVFTLIISFTGCMFLYRWSRRHHSDESALIASALFLLSPLLISQVDTLATAPFLLMIFGIGTWLDQAYRRSERVLGGWFFVQMLTILIAVSIHPMALAYPLALILEWFRNPIEDRQQKHIYIGAALAIIFSQLLHSGWDVQWFSNPLIPLSTMFLGQAAMSLGHWSIGLFSLAILCALLFANRKLLITDLLGRTLLLALVIGMLSADASWSLIALSMILFLATAALINFNRRLGSHNFLGQRGLVMLVLFITTTLFMQGNKAQHDAIASNLLSSQDLLIQTLAIELEDIDDESILVMSEWPGRTMIAIKRPVVPLPPEYDDTQTFLKNIKGITHIIFNPARPENATLRRHLANLSAISETLTLQEGGAIITISSDNKPPTAKHPVKN